jgi:peptide/nickel transport system substrate-binding protein
MKAKRMILLVGVSVLALILCTAFKAPAAAPEGEIKLTAPEWGHEIPIPRMELGYSLDWLKLLYDPLFGATPEGKLSPEYGLVVKWEMSPDGLTWMWKLREGVKFHDGVELTAKDVKFSLEQVMLPDTKSGTASVIRAAVKSMEIKDPYTLIVHCKKPSIFLPSILSDMENVVGFVMPKDYHEKVGMDGFTKRPIGSGPYKWHSQAVGSFIKLEATDKHWRDGVPRYKYVTFLIIPEEGTQIAMLKTGEADITRIGRNNVKDALKSGLKIVSKKDAGAIFFRCSMQWATPAFSDIRFRKALNLAIDRDSIIKHTFEGMAKPFAQYPGTYIFACGGDPTLKPYPYDPQEARRLIKEGGYEGYEFTAVSYQRSGLPEFTGLIETLVGYWQKIGLKPKIAMWEYATFRESMRAQKVPNTLSGTTRAINLECGSLLKNMEEEYASSELRSVVHDPKMDDWLKRASNALDLAEVAKILGEAYRYTYDQHLMIPICMTNDEIAFTKRIPQWDPGLRRADRNINDIIKQR